MTNAWVPPQGQPTNDELRVITESIRTPFYVKKGSVGASYTFSSTVWANLDTGLDITLPGEEGDWLQAGISALWVDQALNGYLNVQLVNSGNHFGDAAAAGVGIAAWAGVFSQYSVVGGAVPYRLVPADIVNGTVLLRLRRRTDAAAAKSLGTAGWEFSWWAANTAGRTSKVS